PLPEQPVAVFGRFLAEYVEAGARDQALLEGLDQRLFIHQSAPSRIDENGRALHFADLLDADHVAGLGAQRHVQRYHVTLHQYLIERGEYDPWCFRGGMIGKQHVHAEAAGDTSCSLAEHSLADDADGRTVQVPDRVVKETELI